MNLNPIDLYKQADAKLKGTPDQILTPVLLAAGLIIIVIALKGSPIMKGAVLAWIVLP